MCLHASPSFPGELLITDSGSNSTDPKGFVDDTTVEYNNQMPGDCVWNIENSDECTNFSTLVLPASQKEANERVHEFNVQYEGIPESLKPVSEGNIQNSEPSKNQLQEELLNKIQEALAFNDANQGPGRFPGLYL